MVIPWVKTVAISLIGLLPRRFAGHHLWRLAPEEHRSWALAQELDSESEFLDDGTVDELATLIVTWNWRPLGLAGTGVGTRSTGCGRSAGPQHTA